MSKTLVLYSGGLDSTVVLAQQIAAGNQVLALSIDYGQSNAFELQRCRQLAGFWGFPHRVIRVELERRDARAEIPARNTIFLAKALELALLGGYDTIAYGAEPDATYTDSSPDYIAAMDKVTQLHHVKLIAPIRNLAGKLAVLHQALNLGVPLDLVHSSRTDQVNGGDSASARFLRTLHTTFPVMNPLALLEEIAAAHKFSDRNPYVLVAPQVGSFKYLPALLLQASMSNEGCKDTLKVYTTGNWGAAMSYVNDNLKRFAKIEVIHTDLVQQLRQNRYNTNAREAVWGVKQALSRLPRPQYLGTPIDCTVIQGHLKRVVEDLGYTFQPGAVPLITQG